MKGNLKYKFRKSHLGVPYGVFMVLFIVLPLLLLFLFAFMEKTPYGNTLSFKFTLDNFVSTFSKANLTALGESFGVGVVCTFLCLLIGYPVAYLLATSKYNKSATLILLFVLPMWINFLMRTLATKAMFEFLGIKFGWSTVIFGTVYNFLPFMILPIYTSISKIDKSLYEASNDLGATNNIAFMKITVPLSLPGILSGMTMVFTPSITTFVISDMLSNKKISFIGNLINLQIEQLNYNVASAISIIILIIIGVSMCVMNYADKDYSTGGKSLW